MAPQFPRLRGIRRTPEFEPDPHGFMLNPKFVEGVRLLRRFNLHFELNVHYTQMESCDRATAATGCLSCITPTEPQKPTDIEPNSLCRIGATLGRIRQDSQQKQELLRTLPLRGRC
jgi:hypothetical protein